jgi:hypothetical protein
VVIAVTTFVVHALFDVLLPVSVAFFVVFRRTIAIGQETKVTVGSASLNPPDMVVSDGVYAYLACLGLRFDWN